MTTHPITAPSGDASSIEQRLGNAIQLEGEPSESVNQFQSFIAPPPG